MFYRLQVVDLHTDHVCFCSTNCHALFTSSKQAFTCETSLCLFINSDKIFNFRVIVFAVVHLSFESRNVSH